MVCGHSAPKKRLMVDFSGAPKRFLELSALWAYWRDLLRVDVSEASGLWGAQE